MNRSPDHIYDELLVLRAQDGEVDAMNELVGRWHGRLGAHARCLIRDREAAADALQEAWHDIVKNIRKLSDPAAYRVWMYRIVSRRCTDHLRRVMRRREPDSIAQADVVDAKAPAAPRAETIEEHDRLRDAIAKLPGELRAMVALRYRENLSTAAIGLAMNCPAGTVKSRLHEARRQLQALLESHQGKG